jgi:predicted transposase YbfD/YdcC
MDQPEYSSLMAGLQAVPDPRHARGKQLEWPFLWGVIASALLSNHRTPAAIAQWAKQQTAALLAVFRPVRGRIPSESTIRRTLRQVDISALEAQLARVVPMPSAPAPPASPLQGQAIDGKYLRGVGAHGQPLELVSLVEHGSGRVLAQTAVAPHQHESRAVPALLAGRDLRGVVVTLDAGLATPALATQIRQQGGQYLMVIKRNHRQLYEELTWFFDTPPLPCDPPWRAATTISKGHGRLETRQLICTADLDDYLRWPGVQQVLRRECERIELKTGKVSQAVTYALTSVAVMAATPLELEGYWRGHWTIENRVHYVRDVSMGEDAQQMHTGNAPQALAALRNTLLTLLRWAGWHNIAAALRHFAGAPQEALQFMGAGE